MLSDDEIKRIIEPHYPRFNQSWHGAFTDYGTKYTETRPVHSKVARAMLLRDHCIDHVKRCFEDRKGIDVEIVEKGLLFLVVMSGKLLGIDGSVAARLKRFNENMLTSNIPTGQSNSFAEQKPVVIRIQGELFGEPIILPKQEPVHVNIGYRPNDLHTEAEGVYASLPNGKRSIKWFVRISDGQSSEGAVIEMPITPVEPQDQTRKRVHVKKKKAN